MGEIFKPEEIVEIQLWDWLKVSSFYVNKIYFNRKNVLNAEVFTTIGINKKPDFIINGNFGYGEEYIAVEIKDNKKRRNVLDAGKILDIYYFNYATNKTKYFINSKEIKLDYFLVATQDSKKGYLYENETFVKAEESKNESKKYVANLGIIPKIEGNETHQYVRGLWSSINRLMDVNVFINKPAIGILISENERPKMMVKKLIVDKNKKERWAQRWIQL